MPRRLQSRRVRRSTKQFVTKAQLRRTIGGNSIRPSVDPPVVRPQQWNNARLVFFATGSKSFTDSTIISGIQTQLGFTPTSPFALFYRVKEARIWLELTPTTPLKAPLQCRFHSVYGEGFSLVEADYGSNNQYARCGYRWPLTDRDATLGLPSVDLILEVLPVDTTRNWIAYIDVLWSLQKPASSAEVLDGTIASLPPSHFLVSSFDDLRL